MNKNPSPPSEEYQTGQIINNSAIQMTIKPKQSQINIEDTYETLNKLDLGIKPDDIPETCDV